MKLHAVMKREASNSASARRKTQRRRYVTFIHSNNLSLSVFSPHSSSGCNSHRSRFSLGPDSGNIKKVRAPLPVSLFFSILCSFVKGHSELILRSHE